MSEGYDHWHTDMTISRDDDPGDHPDPYRATPGTATDWDDDDVRDRDERDRIADADDLFTT